MEHAYIIHMFGVLERECVDTKPHEGSMSECECRSANWHAMVCQSVGVALVCLRWSICRLTLQLTFVLKLVHWYWLYIGAFASSHNHHEREVERRN